MNLASIKALIFDLDGVLIESNKMRDDAFVHIFSSIGCYDVNRILQIHRSNRGMYRKNKISLICHNIFQKEPSEILLQELLEKFSNYIKEHIIHCPKIPGALEFLDSQKDKDLFIVSTAAQNEVLWIAEYHKIYRFFKGIFGGPTDKKTRIEEILKTNHYQPSEVVFIGDQISDLQAAKDTGINFIGRVSEESGNPFPDNISIFYDFSELFDI